MDASQKGTAENKILVMWVIWGAMLGSLVIYIVICNLFGDQIRRPMGTDFPLALCESVGIYGMVLFFLGDSFQTLYTFMVISAAGMFYYRPKREELEALSSAYS